MCSLVYLCKIGALFLSIALSLMQTKRKHFAGFKVCVPVLQCGWFLLCSKWMRIRRIRSSKTWLLSVCQLLGLRNLDCSFSFFPEFGVSCSHLNWFASFIAITAKLKDAGKKNLLHILKEMFLKKKEKVIFYCLRNRCLFKPSCELVLRFNLLFNFIPVFSK